jgi:tetratricopeptide (TPR) repeat protein
MRVAKVLLVMATCLVWLAGCETSTKLGDVFRSNDNGAQAVTPPSDSDATGSIPSPGEVPGATNPGLFGGDPNDDLSIGKRYYRQEDFGLAERYFRRAVESHPKDAEAWLGLAAAYDRLKRFDLADRAYGQAIAIVGPTAEVLNNQGYSYILRGDYRRAQEKLAAAQALDPGNVYINNNLALLAKSTRKGKAVQ